MVSHHFLSPAILISDIRHYNSAVSIIRPCLDSKTASTIAASIVGHSKLDYCNSLLQSEAYVGWAIAQDRDAKGVEAAA